MSQNEQRQALGRRQSDYEAVALREKVAEHEALLTILRTKVANQERDVEAILSILRSITGQESISVLEKLKELEDAIRESLL